MSIHNYNRALVGRNWTIRIPLLAQETKAALPGKTFRLRAEDVNVRFDFDDVLTAGEVATLDATVAAHIAAGPYVNPPSKPPRQIRLTSPDGTVHRITVSNAGVLVVTPI